MEHGRSLETDVCAVPNIPIVVVAVVTAAAVACPWCWVYAILMRSNKVRFQLYYRHYFYHWWVSSVVISVSHSSNYFVRIFNIQIQFNSVQFSTDTCKLINIALARTTNKLNAQLGSGKKRVFNLVLKLFSDSSGLRRCTGSAFQAADEAKWNPRGPNVLVFVRGIDSDLSSVTDDLRWAWTVAGTQRSDR